MIYRRSPEIKLIMFLKIKVSNILPNQAWEALTC